jgi:hypothetical protein
MLASMQQGLLILLHRNRRHWGSVSTTLQAGAQPLEKNVVSLEVRSMLLWFVDNWHLDIS